jgi:dihydrofolate synthase/folylpolyglutamate synthase
VARAAVDLGCDHVLAADTVAQACVLAMEGTDGDDAVLAAGSLYVAGAARPALKRLLP